MAKLASEEWKTDVIYEELHSRFKNSPSVKALARELKAANVDVSQLNEEEINTILLCFFVASRDVAEQDILNLSSSGRG